MKAQVIQIAFNEKKGPTIFHKLKFQTKSSIEGTLKVYRQGPSAQFDQKLNELREQQQKFKQYGLRRCDQVKVKNIFEAFEYLECKFEGSQADKKAMLKELGLEQQIKSFYKTEHDHVVRDTFMQGYVCDSKYYYQVISHLIRPEGWC